MFCGCKDMKKITTIAKNRFIFNFIFISYIDIRHIAATCISVLYIYINAPILNSKIKFNYEIKYRFTF